MALIKRRIRRGNIVEDILTVIKSTQGILHWLVFVHGAYVFVDNMVSQLLP